MSDYKIKDLYQGGQYEQGVQYASSAEVREGFNEWDYLYYVYCLYKEKHYLDALTVYKEFHKKFPQSSLLDDKTGWCLYYAYIKPFDFEHGNKYDFTKKIDYILEHSSDSEYSPKLRAAMYAADAVFGKKLGVNPDYELGEHFLSYIDPMKLSLEEHEIEIDGNKRKTASDREKWYTRKTKALVELKKYDECLSMIEEAFINVDRFHNNGKHWMNYKKARCNLGLGKPDLAVDIIQQTLKSFQHWSLYELLFNVAATENDLSKALQYGALCATADPEHKLRVTFYENFARYLLVNGRMFEAALHYKLVEELRAKEGWKSIHLPDGFQYPDNVAALDKDSLMQELYRFWNEEKDRGKEFHEGEIKCILPNGKSGFIRDNDGKEYYFNVQDFVKKIRELQEGIKVKYTLEERLDKKKNEVKLSAVDIRLMK